MRSDYIRIYKSVHTWTGILTGLALFIAFYAGALTVFKEPLARWVSPPAPAALAVSLADSQVLIERTLAAHPAATKGFQLNLELAEHQPARMSWHEREEGQDDHDALAGRHYTATLSTNGSARIEEAQPSQLAEFIDILHRVVGLPFDNDPARWFMGIVASLYALALFSGVIVLLPSLVKDFFALRAGKNLKRMWLDAHNIVGIVSLPFHIVMAITAVVFAYHDGIYALQNRLIHSGNLAGAFVGSPTAKPAPRDPASMLPPPELLARASALAPDFMPSSLQYVNLGSPRAMVRVWGTTPASLAPRALGGFVALDPFSGKVLNSDFMPGKQNGANLTISSFFALHMATFGGMPVRWMYFLLGLAGAWLFYSGNLLWIESRRKKAQQSGSIPEQRRDTRWLAAGTVGVCFGCISGISLTIAAGKWLNGHVADLNAWHWYVYYAIFFASLAWAFLRGPGRAAVELLWLTALCTFAIPLTSLLAWLSPALGMWAHTSTLGVDLTALAGGFMLLWAARATARRVRSGPADSVWSAPCAAKA
ncbi:PepSY-associated TM helix domain-containing protein [Uliginosibacterium sp. 31-16]|uniref:PepSY-associated TM helix domain-containing protein n=1 Tax=Uliginosibacterium sp. 31-16 TaxID=3068315 RepID=UPI00273E2DDC|nr:PepSY-associated TM helix domain-containing protein [Uliginosibacterium sp. 31-16]MDP5239640.1 PepSY-associated TM helix domain-containing protein [Uliginosibacterium sp. 31-16]